MQQEVSKPQQTLQSSHASQQQGASSGQHWEPHQRSEQQHPLQRHPHHPPTSQPSGGDDASSFGSTADLFGGGPAEQSLFPVAAAVDPAINTFNTPGLQQGHSNTPVPAVPGGSQPKGRPPLPPASLQKRPSVTPTLPIPSTPPLIHPRPPGSNRQQQQQQSQSRPVSLSAQSPQRFNPIAPGPQGVQQQSVTPYQPLATGSPRVSRLGSVSNLPSGSPHASHVHPKTPLLSAVQAASTIPSQRSQGQTSTPSLPQTPPQVVLQSCPFSDCPGENKPQAKFCSECGRPISLASQSATPLLGPRSEFVPGQASPMPSLDRMNSFSQEQIQLQPQITQNQEQPYYQQEYSQNQLWDSQGYSNDGYDYQQQQYDPSTGQYLDHTTPEQKQEPEPVEPEPVEPERIDDPLNRYLGCPLVAFGFGGSYHK